MAWRAKLRPLGALALISLLAACGLRLIPAVQPPAAPVSAPANAVAAGITPGVAISKLALDQADAAGALASFRESCGQLTSRADQSGLTRPADWAPACAAAAKWPDEVAPAFFTTYFETAQIGPGQAFVTGYYEPEIAGSRSRQPGFEVPVYRLPADLVRARPGDSPATDNGIQPLGRYDASGKFVPYYTRGEIYDGALAGKGLELAWAADPVEMFFLQIQGSGRLRTTDGTVIRIGYAGQNGHPYTGIGAVMRERGLIGSGPGQYAGSMQGIMQYVRDHPEDGNALMRENKSFVFFRELDGDAPLGALGVPVRGGASVAVDPAFVPLGAPVWLDLDRAEASGLWVAQDTGGAIKGANRFDSFWGHGDTARVTAGGMAARGRAVVMVPRGTLARLAQN